jgi:hypothetical protein
MPAYSALIQAVQARRGLFRTILVRLEFASETMQVWLGQGPLRTLDGAYWQGIGQIGKISEIDRQLVSSSTPTLSLSGVDTDVLAKALASESEVKGRSVSIFEQYFDDDHSLVDNPLPLWVGIMDQMRITTDATTSTVAVTTAGLAYNRRRPSYAYLNDASQRRLYPGDRGCSELARLVQSTENWPAYS